MDSEIVEIGNDEARAYLLFPYYRVSQAPPTQLPRELQIFFPARNSGGWDREDPQERSEDVGRENIKLVRIRM